MRQKHYCLQPFSPPCSEMLCTTCNVRPSSAVSYYSTKQGTQSHLKVLVRARGNVLPCPPYLVLVWCSNTTIMLTLILIKLIHTH